MDCNLCSRNSPHKNIGVGSHSRLQGDLPGPGVEPGSATLPADSLPSAPPERPRTTREAPATEGGVLTSPAIIIDSAVFPLLCAVCTAVWYSSVSLNPVTLLHEVFFPPLIEI